MTAWRDGREIDLGPPQQRRLLALLLLHRGRPVSTDTMLEALWHGDPPRTAAQVIRDYVSRLRGRLGDEGAGSPVLRRHRHGYELSPGAGRVDAERFESLVGAGRGALGGGDADEAVLLLSEALSLVRGPPLPELCDDDHARCERERLEEMRNGAEEDLIEAQLVQGRHHELVPALRAAVRAQPLRERLWGQLIVALYRSGRQGEALGAYRAAYRTLRDRLGIVPGPALRELERMVLVHDESLDPPPRQERRLPAYRTSLLGREEDLSVIADALRRHAIVTLAGPAGAGKTRLAAEVAARLQQRSGTRVWWVELGSTGPGRVVAAVARQLAVRDVPGRTAAQSIVARLRGTGGLLVVDNCEHVLADVAGLVDRLLAEAPGLRVLATSREALRVDAETVHPVPGLALPPAGATGSAEVFGAHAPRLLAERAGVDPSTLDEADATAFADVARRLDGLPLAIELAAGKLRSLTAPELAEELRERLWVLDPGARPGPRRQRTLEAAIGWSHELLDERERVVLRRLGVFPGGFDAAAARAVAGGDGVEPSAVVPALTRLVEASLLVAERTGGTTRYRFLETVRAFARERAVEAGELDLLARRHRDAYARLVEDVQANMVGAGLALWLPRARRDHDNLLAALHWSFEHGDADVALQIASGLGLFWFRTGYVVEGSRLLDRALRAAGPDSPWRARGLAFRGWLAYAAASPDVLDVARAAVAAGEARADPAVLATAVRVEAYALMAAGALGRARESIERARGLAAGLGDEEGLAIADQQLGNLRLHAGDLDGATAALLDARDRMRRLRVDLDAGWVLVELARVRLAQDRPAEAVAPATEAVVDFRRREDARGVAASLVCLGRAYAALGERDRARALLAQAADLARRWGHHAEAQAAERAGALVEG